MTWEYEDGGIEKNTITFRIEACDPPEVLKISSKGVWVRGVKVEQDENEAQTVYEGMKALLNEIQRVKV